MADDKSKTGNDSALVSLEQDYEVRDWMQSFGCSEAQLREAVAAVGHSAAKVRQYLNGRS